MEAKKSLGQNFLRDKAILRKIADFAQIEKGDTVVEVGPGEWLLTELLLERAAKVICVEKDDRLAKILIEKFSQEITDSKLEIVNEDILNYELITPNYILVGNIPYYITGALFKKFLEAPNQPKSLTFVTQKEVADRIVSKDKKESLLSISIKAYGEPKYGGIIKAGSFFPKPKVDSGIISIRNISKIKFQEDKVNEPKFFEVLRAGFAHKRKLLLRNLDEFGSKEKLKSAFDKCGISEKARAEELKVENWICLTKNLL